MRAISIIAAAALATAAFPAGADEASLRLAQAEIDQGVDDEAFDEEEIDKPVLEESIDEDLPGVGTEGIGMEGIGMDGIGMDGVGMDGIGMESVPDEEIEPVILGSGATIEIRLTDEGIVLVPIEAGADTDEPGREGVRLEIVNTGSGAHRLALDHEGEDEDLDVLSETLGPGERTTVTLDLPGGVYEAYDPLLDDAEDQAPVIVGVRR